MLANFHQSFNQQTLKVVKQLAFKSSDYVEILLSKLERSAFEIHLTWRILKHKSKVYVYQVAFLIQKYIAVMTILHIKYVVEQRVPCEAFYKVFLCLFIISDKVLLKESMQCPGFLFFREFAFQAIQ